MRESQPSSPHTSLPRLGDYRVLDVLGQGGMGVVYRAEHAVTGQHVAIKTVRLPRKQELMSMRREIHALTQLSHPYVVRFLDHGVERGRPWYAMELLAGRTLSDLRDEAHPWRRRLEGAWGEAPTQPSAGFRVGSAAAPLPDEPTFAVADALGVAPRPSITEHLPRILDVTARLCTALSYIHGRGIIHRDLKPANIFLRNDGSPVLVDFGLVVRQGGADGRLVLEAHDGGRGTPAYMAPEQIHGDAVDARADYYALGCLIFELLTGQCPFEGETVFEVINHHISTPPVPPSRLVDGVPEALDDLVLCLLAKRARERIGHADDVISVLRQLGVRGVDVPEEGHAVLYRAVMVGRFRARSTLQQLLADASLGQGGVALIGGESGVGKTHLATSITANARKRGMRIITGECQSGGTGGALHPLRPLLQAIGDRCLEHGPAVARQLLGARGRILAAFEPMLDDIPGVRELPEPARLPPDAERERVIHALTEVLQGFVAEMPLLLIIDDLQWADDLTMVLLRSLNGAEIEQQALALVGTWRSDELNDPLRALLALPWVRQIMLDRLSEDEITAMVGEMLAIREPPPSLVRFLTQQSEGNPFFVAEYLRAAVADRILVRERGRWHMQQATDAATSYDNLGLPHTIREIVTRRIATISQLGRSIVEAAAVFGREAPMEVVFRAAEVDDQAGFGELSRLYEGQVLEQGRDGNVRFVHHKLLENAYADIAPPRRARLHRRVAEALESRHRGLPDFELHYAALARHWHAAEDPKRALHYLELAGAHAVNAAAHAAAIQHITEALRLRESAGLAPTPVQAARLHRLIGESHLGLGSLAEARRHLQQAAALLRWPVPEGRGDAAAALAAEVAVQAVHRVVPSGILPSDRSVDELTEGARTYEMLQTTERPTGNALLILLTALRSLNLAELGTSNVHRANGYALAQVIAASVPLTGLAETYGKLAQRALRGCDDKAAEVWVYQMAAVYHTSRGDLTEGLDWALRAITLADEIGYRFRWEESSVVAAYAETYLGRVRAALERYNAICRSSRRGAIRHTIWSLAGQARARVVLGEPQAAHDLYDELGALPQGGMEPLDRLIVASTRAWGGVALGDLDQALPLLREAHVGILKMPPAVFEISGCCADLCEAWARLWHRSPRATVRQEAAQRQRAVVQALGRFARPFPLLEGDAWCGQGESALIARDTKAAARAFEQAQRAAASRGLVLQQLRALSGQLRCGTGDLALFRRLMAECGAQPEFIILDPDKEL